jgi:RNA polymerase sigma factor (sigma-70 family)
MRYGPVLFRSRAELDAGTPTGDVDRSRRAPGRRGRAASHGPQLLSRPPGHDEEVTRLVRAAANGDQQAWDAIVSRYVALLWSIAFRHGLGESDAADVVQNTWLRLFEHIHDVREPARVGSWLATTAQRESLRIVAQRQRVVPSDDEATFDGADRLQAPLDEALLAREQAAEVRAALDTLPPAWRSLVELLTQDPPLSYERIVADLGLPIGSIGPTRGRCVRRLRALVAD